MAKVLIACESSGVVRRAFRQQGHNAWSCDLQSADDDNRFHIQGDCIDVIESAPWDIVIAHPPCTHLASSGARWFEQKRQDGRMQQGIDFFLSIVQSCSRIYARWAIENPIGIMSTHYQKPTQIIHPWQFGHGETKATCLWLEGLKPLTPTNIVPGRESKIHRMPPSKDRWKKRSRTYDGIAAAMAMQWGGRMAEGKWAVQHSSKRHDWATPQSLFAWLDAEFDFALDAAACADSTKCAEFISPEDDALSLPIGEWAERAEQIVDLQRAKAAEPIPPRWPTIWLNPPYNKVEQWCKRAWLEALAGAIVVVLVFASTDTRWWKDAFDRTHEIRLLTGRISFLDPDTRQVVAAAPKGSALLIFKPGRREGVRPVFNQVTPPR